MQTFRVTLILTKPEAEALARNAQNELRDLRSQARYLLLKALGLLPDADPDPAAPSGDTQRPAP